MTEESIDWRRILTRASTEVQKAVAEVVRNGERSVSLGVGASGDRTLLADKKAEDAILKELGGVKGLRVIAEEAGELGDPASSLIAIVDPLDGSSNFQKGIPFYCTAVAVVNGRRLDDARAALVRNLVTGDSYFAEKGKGATKNGARIFTSGVAKLADAVAGVDLSGPDPRTARLLGPLLAGARRQVHFGANALELCMLAEGTIDAFVDVRDKLRVVDYAGAYLIAKEAGATLTTPSGGRSSPALTLESRFSVVASANPILHRRILRALGKAA